MEKKFGQPEGSGLSQHTKLKRSQSIGEESSKKMEDVMKLRLQQQVLNK